MRAPNIDHESKYLGFTIKIKSVPASGSKIKRNFYFDRAPDYATLLIMIAQLIKITIMIAVGHTCPMINITITRLR